MKTTLSYAPFNPYEIPLRGINLIEASAGTGKTYSITLLVLRLLLEKRIPIQEILLVTFTNSAAAELEIRIRDFVRRAYQLSLAEAGGEAQETDSEIRHILSRTTSSDKNTTQILLEEAMLFMDELKVMTLHGFCQKTLADYPLETRQLFDASISNSTGSFVEQYVNNFWRQQVATLSPEFIYLLSRVQFSRTTLIQAYAKISEGYTPNATSMPDADEVVQLVQFVQTLPTPIEQFVQAHWQAYLEANDHRGKGTSLSAKAIKERAPVHLIRAIKKGVDKDEEWEKMKGRPELKNYPPLLDFLAQIKESKAKLNAYSEEIANALLYSFYRKTLPEIEQFKGRNSLLTFSDLTHRLHSALQDDESNHLKYRLQRDYKAVFIDEFQDTDMWQYEIFRIAFHTAAAPLVFYIGDPKQLIYTWRGADLRMYKSAITEIKQRYTMNVNYRSSPHFIEAMNLYFPTGTHCNTQEKNNPFCDDVVRYTQVECGKEDFPTLFLGGEEIPALRVMANPEGKDQTVVQEVLRLLHKGQFRYSDRKIRPVYPQDIALLTRSNRHARALKTLLSEVGVPSIIRDETKVISTQTAQHLYYILSGILDLDPGSIRRALYSPLTPKYTDPYHPPNLPFHTRTFARCKEQWDGQGVFAAILHFMATYEVRHTLLDATANQGERHYANLIQLAEILNATEHHRQLAPEKLMDWLAKSIENPPENTDYEQRIETEDAALTISTIHKSKGLQYNIVLLPKLDVSKPKKTKKLALITYFDSGDHPRISLGYPNSAMALETHFESAAEMRRLYYVALTRAVHGAVVFKNKQNELLEAFHIPQGAPKNILGSTSPSEEKSPPYQAEQRVKYSRVPRRFDGDTRQQWIATSYSGLDTHVYTPLTLRAPEDYPSDYDRYIFEQLPKGALIGNFLHYLLEHLIFDAPNKQVATIERACRLFGLEQPELLEQLPSMITHIVEAVLPIGDEQIQLCSIPAAKRMNELEFYFNFTQWPRDDLKQRFNTIQTQNISHAGVMHGFIDLVFEYKGKFYILDWKSNHLGYDLSCYTGENLKKAMEENNYTLQYHVYTLAAVRYLQSQLTEFDYDLHFGGVIYVFLRGVRSGESTGVYTARPKWEDIERMNQLVSTPKHDVQGA